MAESKKSTRRPRFSYEELDALADAVEQHKLVIFNRLTDVITSRDKNRAWEEVTSAVNSVATVKRDVREIRRKWKDWQSVVKAKEQARKKLQSKTGGGNTIITLTPPEAKVIAIIGTTAVDGIPNSIDSLTPPNTTASKVNESHEVVDKEEQTKKIKLYASTSSENPTTSETLHSEGQMENDLLSFESGDDEVPRQKSSKRPLKNDSSSSKSRYVLMCMII